MRIQKRFSIATTNIGRSFVIGIASLLLVLVISHGTARADAELLGNSASCVHLMPSPSWFRPTPGTYFNPVKNTCSVPVCIYGLYDQEMARAAGQSSAFWDLEKCYDVNEDSSADPAKGVGAREGHPLYVCEAHFEASGIGPTNPAACLNRLIGQNLPLCMGCQPEPLTPDTVTTTERQLRTYMDNVHRDNLNAASKAANDDPFGGQSRSSAPANDDPFGGPSSPANDDPFGNCKTDTAATACSAH